MPKGGAKKPDAANDRLGGWTPRAAPAAGTLPRRCRMFLQHWQVFPIRSYTQKSNRKIFNLTGQTNGALLETRCFKHMIAICLFLAGMVGSYNWTCGVDTYRAWLALPPGNLKWDRALRSVNFRLAAIPTALLRITKWSEVEMVNKDSA